MTLTQNITLDVARETALHIAGKQFDENSRFLLVTIKEAGEEKSVPAGSAITLNARRPDGSAQSFAGSRQDGKAFVEIDQWILEQYGTVYCSISVVDSEAAKLTTLSFRLLVERAEGSGFVLVYVAAANLPAGTYYIPMAGVNYFFTTTQAVPAGGKIYFSSIGTTGKTTNNGATIEDLTLTAGSTGTELQGSDIVNFLTQMQANVAAIDGELDSKADKSAIEENLAAGTSLATIDKDSYTPSTTPYLYRQSPSGKRCEYDVIGGTVGWNQLIRNGNFASTSNWTPYFGATFTVADGVASIVGNGNANGSRIFQDIPRIADHKYIFSCDIKTDGTVNGIVSFDSTAAITKTIEATTSWTQVTFALSAGSGSSATMRLHIRVSSGVAGTVYVRNVNLIDLTTLLGSTIADYAYQLEQTTAGSGIAWLRSFGFLTKSYYPYCEPTLESVQATARVARGINQWDEVWRRASLDTSNGTWSAIGTYSQIASTNYIPVLPNTAYYENNAMFVAKYDAEKNYIGYVALTSPNTFTTDANCHYIMFQMYNYGTTYLNDICINISNPTINGQYFPYDSHTYPLGEVTLRGIPKLDSSNNIYYDGDVYKASGEITRKYGVVDLGTIDYSYESNYSRFSISHGVMENVKIPAFTDIPNALIIPFKIVTSNAGWAGRGGSENLFCIDPTGYLRFYSTQYSSAAAFKTAMSGVYLVYELATPTTETTDSFTPIQYTGSTEEFTTSNDVPVGVDAKYYTDLTLPKLPTANGTYTLKCTVTDGTGIVSWVSE